jgi:hypothetical protein
MQPKDLHPRQYAILKTIVLSNAYNGKPPTRRDVAKQATDRPGGKPLPMSVIAHHLRRLIDFGLVQPHDKHEARSLRPTPAGSEMILHVSRFLLSQDDRQHLIAVLEFAAQYLDGSDDPQRVIMHGRACDMIRYLTSGARQPGDLPPG